MCYALYGVLVVSHQIVTHHNGTLHVHSDGVGHGTTMTVRLPAKHCFAPDKALEEQRLTTTATNHVENSVDSCFEEAAMTDLGTLLFAEDVKLNRKIMKKSLGGTFSEIIEVV
jgi:hypothetical protein